MPPVTPGSARPFLVGLVSGIVGFSLALAVLWAACVGLVHVFPPGSADWVSAFGTVSAIAGAAWIARSQTREAARVEQRKRAARLVHASRIVLMAYDEIRRAGENFDFRTKRRQGPSIGYASVAVVLRSMAAAERAMESFPIELIEEEPVIRVLYFVRTMLSLARGDVEGLAGLKPPEDEAAFQEAADTLREAADEVAERFRPVWPITEPERAAAEARRRERATR